MKKNYLFLFLLLATIKISTLSGQPDKGITLGGATGGSYIARDWVHLGPGLYSPGGSYFNAKIDESLVCPVDYQNPVDPNTRTINTSLPVGTTPGSANVSESGGLTYAIPIFVPPGTAGMQPNIGITYSSNSSDGLLGRGWNLSGISLISRSGTNIYNDNSIDGIDFDSNDKFLLDGNRLVTSGTYGANGTVYYTEFDNFQKVTSHGSAGNGPSYFTVQTKSGMLLEYGSTADSRIEAQGKSDVLYWYINKVTDQAGNYMTFSYHEDNANGVHYPVKIDYTANDAAGLQAYNSVEFFYENKIHANTKYILDSKIEKSVVLYKIKTASESSIAREYRFNYVESSNEQPLLHEIVEYNKEGEHYNSTIIDWGGLELFCDRNEVTINDDKKIYGDFNGDGRTDFVSYPKKDAYSTSDSWTLYLTNATGKSFTVAGTGALDANFIAFYTGDFNGDGRTDLLRYSKSNKLKAMYSTGNNFSNQTEITKSYQFEPVIGDFDGDGLSDILIRKRYSSETGDNWEIYSATAANLNALTIKYSYQGSGSTFPYDIFSERYNYLDLNHNGIIDAMYDKQTGKIIFDLTGYSLPTSYIARLNIQNQPFDYDGDGKQDIIRTIENTTSLMYFENGIFNTETLTTEFNDNEKIYYGYFNNDNRVDFMTFNQDNEWTIYYSSGYGSGLVSKTVTALYIGEIGGNKMGDFNGDGLTDMFAYGGIRNDPDRTIVDFYLALNTGDGFAPPIEISIGSQVIDNLCVTCGAFTIIDFNGDGKDDVFYDWGYFKPSTDEIIMLSSGKDNLLVKTILNGLNHKTNIGYKPLTSSSVYTKGSGSSYPITDYQGSMYVVSSVGQDNGTGGQNTVNYTYNGMRVHLQGRGMLGFTGVKSENTTQGIKTQNTYSYDNTYYYSILTGSVTKTTSDAAISSATYTNAVKELNTSQKRIFPYVQQIVAQNSLEGTTNTGTYQYDDYGNLTSQTTNYNGTGSILVSNTYVNANSWCLNKPQTSTVTKTRSGESNYVFTTSNSYTQEGFLYTSATGGSKPVTTTYTYNNPFGLPSGVESTATGLDSRFAGYVYDSKGRFATEVTNSLGHTVKNTYDATTGNIITNEDANGLLTIFQYDGFGNLTETALPDNVQKINSSIRWKDAGGPSNSLFYTLTEATASSPVKTYYDVLGRGLRNVAVGFNGSNIYTDNQYNAKGQLYRASEPSFSTPSEWTVYTYDAFGRNTGINSPTGDYSISYSGLSVTTTNTSANPDQVTTKTYDAMGLLATVSQPYNNSLVYEYYSIGLPKQVTATGNAVTTFQYDEYGNRTQITEPNSGTIISAYNAFGETVSETRNGNVFSYTYDRLGRALTKTNTADNIVTHYNYDSRFLGMPDSIWNTGNNTDSEGYYFDGFGRVTRINENRGGTTLTETYEYDNYGRIKNLHYPTGFSVAYSYNNRHYLDQIKRGDNQALIWEAQAANAYGQLSQFRSGNNYVTTRNFNHGFLTGIATGSNIQNLSYTWDYGTGNLLQRKNNLNDVYEDFSYDNLNRLTGVFRNGTGTTPGNYTFSFCDNGNIGESPFAGSYAYDATKKHAVAAVTNVNSYITDQQTVYSALNKLTSVNEGIDSLATIGYGVHNQRAFMDYSYGGLKNFERRYAFGNFEKDVYTDGSGIVKERNYIYSPAGLAAIYEKTNSSGSMYYIHTDLLGSYDVITDQSGSVAERLSFDAWGRRRNATDWTYTNVPTSFKFDRGYTGHEHLDEFGLINMNGRMYDPLVGRFLSPDVFVQAPSDAQSFNRYSYVLNNPLKFTDPSGWSSVCGMDPFGWSDVSNCGDGKNGWEHYLNETSTFVSNGPGYISSSYVNGAGIIVDVRNDDDHNIYLVDENWDGTKNTVLGIIGYTEDPYALEGLKGFHIFSWAVGTKMAMSGGGWVLFNNYGYSMMPEVTVKAKAPASSGGDWYQYAIDGAGIASGAAGAYYGFKGNATHNELYWQGKNGKLYSTSKLTKPGGYARSYKVVNNSLRTAKGLSNSMAGVSLLVTGVDIAYNQQVNASHAVNAFMAGIAFTGVGSIVAGAYFLTDLGFEVFTGTSLGERIDNAVGGSLYEW